MRSDHTRQRISPGPGQESVWDYPRPPAVSPSSERVVVELGGVVIAETTRALRVLEMSHPPVYYVPIAAVRAVALQPSDRVTYCEFKGLARYYDVVGGSRRERNAAWGYPSPSAGYETLLDHVAFYPGRMDRCLVADEVVRAQAGNYYGGWITSRIVGPFKGCQGARGW